MEVEDVIWMKRSRKPKAKPEDLRVSSANLPILPDVSPSSPTPLFPDNEVKIGGRIVIDERAIELLDDPNFPPPVRSPSPPAPPPTPASPPVPVVVADFCPGCEADAPIPEGVDILTEKVCAACEPASLTHEEEKPTYPDDTEPNYLGYQPGQPGWIPDDCVVIRRRDLAVVVIAALLGGLVLPDLF